MARTERRGKRGRREERPAQGQPVGPRDAENVKPSDEELRKHRPTKEDIRRARREEE